MYETIGSCGCTHNHAVQVHHDQLRKGAEVGDCGLEKLLGPGIGLQVAGFIHDRFHLFNSLVFQALFPDNIGGPDHDHLLNGGVDRQPAQILGELADGSADGIRYAPGLIVQGSIDESCDLVLGQHNDHPCQGHKGYKCNNKVG